MNIGVVGLIINIIVFGCKCLVGGVVSFGGEPRYKRAQSDKKATNVSSQREALYLLRTDDLRYRRESALRQRRQLELLRVQ